MRYHLWPMLAVAVACVAPLPALAVFRCPAADATATGEKPTLSADDMARTHGTLSAALEAIVHRMQAEGMKSGEIVDRLVVADCSRTDAEPNLSDAGKAGQVRQFASKIAQYVYATPGQSEEDILLAVQVPAPLYEHLRGAADKAAVSDDVWINEAIAAKLGKP